MLHCLILRICALFLITVLQISETKHFSCTQFSHLSRKKSNKWHSNGIRDIRDLPLAAIDSKHDVPAFLAILQKTTVVVMFPQPHSLVLYPISRGNIVSIGC